MDDLDELQASEFITDTEDQDSLDERIDSEQRLRNQQLWASFQNAACCITKLYKDRAQPNISPWVPFQNAASNLTTLYKDCIESQRRFAKIGYQVGRRRQMRDLKKWLAKNKQQIKKQSPQINVSNEAVDHNMSTCESFAADDQANRRQFSQNGTVSSILAVNQLNLGNEESQPSSQTVQEQPIIESSAQQISNEHRRQANIHSTAQHQQQSQSNLQCFVNNTEDDLVTFQQALTVRGVKSGQNRRPYLNPLGYISNRTLDPSESEEDKLYELNQFLSEEYHRHVGSRKRSCGSHGGNMIKRVRD